jgi:predicted transcriptional regulator
MITMSATETAILTFFRRYQIGPHQMLFFNANDCKLGPGSFRTAMQSLVSRGLVIKERPAKAYSLTRDGYDLSLSVERATQH